VIRAGAISNANPPPQRANESAKIALSITCQCSFSQILPKAAAASLSAALRPMMPKGEARNRPDG